MTKNRLTELAGIVADPKPTSERGMIKEGLTGPMSITDRDLKSIARQWERYYVQGNEPDMKALKPSSVIAQRLLTLLAQPNRSEEADRILSFLLK